MTHFASQIADSIDNGRKWHKQSIMNVSREIKFMNLKPKMPADQSIINYILNFLITVKTHDKLLFGVYYFG